MLTDNQQIERVYSGYNPKFVQRVRASRKEAFDSWRRQERDAILSMMYERPDLSIEEIGAKFNRDKNVVARLWKLHGRKPAPPSSKSADPASVREVIAEVAARYGFQAEYILSNRRTHRALAARHEAICEAYRRFYDRKKGYSLPWLGRQFACDHTTILHVIRKYGVHPKERNK